MDILGNPEIRDLPLSLPSCRAQVEAFLAGHGLGLQPVDYYAGVFVGEALLACGGFAGSVIQCVAAAESARGLGLINLLITHLRQLMRQVGASNIFVFTKPENLEIFQSLAFYPVGQAAKAVLLESDRRGIARYAEALRAALPGQEGERGCIVMNCNPFTLGHQYLIEQAAARCGQLLILLVEEDRSAFPFEARLALTRTGCAHLGNVTVLPGGPYVISSATFPGYFIKEMSDVVVAQTALDIDIFARHIAPGLGITARFAGEEPSDPVTAAYNAAMAARLPESGVEVHIIPRRELGGVPISASRVRALIREGKLDEIASLVPQSTYDYIMAHHGALTL